MLAQHVLNVCHRACESARSFPEGGFARFGRVAALLGTHAHRMQRLVGRVVAESAHRAAELPPSTPQNRPERVRSAFARVVVQHQIRGGKDQLRARLPVTRLPEHRVEVCSGRGAIRVETPDDTERRLHLRRRELCGMRAKAFALHFDVAHYAELRPQPAEVGTQLGRPLLVDEAVECAEVGSESPGRDAGLVHRLRVVVTAVVGLVRDQAVVRVCDRTPYDRRNGEVLCTHDEEASGARTLARAIASSWNRTCDSIPATVSTFRHVPSRSSVHASTSSEKLIERISSSRARIRASVTRNIASTRRSRLRGIRSAEPMTYSLSVSPALPNRMIRECSR